MRLTPDFLHHTAQAFGLPVPLYRRFLFSFLQDDTAKTLCAAVRSRDVQTAYRAAHTLKGTCAQLGLTELSDTAASLCPLLSGNSVPDWHEISRKCDLILQMQDDIAAELRRLTSEGL